MALYEHKEFLNFEDLKSYLVDYGVCRATQTGRQTIIDFLKGLIFEKKLTPIYFFNGVFKEYHATAIECDLSKIEINNSRLKRYFKIVSDELLNAIFRDTETLYPITMEHCIPYEENIIFEFGKPMYADWVFDDESGFITAYDIVYSKTELDKLFNQPTDQTAQLHAEIDRLTAENQQQADTIQQLKERLETGTPAEPIDDIVTNAKSLNTIENIIFALVELSGKDNSSPTSQNKNSLNGSITQILENAGLPNNYQTTGEWLKKAKNKKKSSILSI